MYSENLLFFKWDFFVCEFDIELFWQRQYNYLDLAHTKYNQKAPLKQDFRLVISVICVNVLHLFKLSV